MTACINTSHEKIKRRRVILSADLGPGKTVSIAGDFNNWLAGAQPMTDKNNNGIYRCTLLLKPGIYEYKLVVDGVWCIDTNNPDFAPNDLGTLNSLLTVE